MTPAPVWKHFAAFLYDIFPVLGILLLTNLLVLFARGGEEVPAGTLWFSLLIFFEIFFYYVYSWKVGGQTLGMRAWKLKIVKHHELTHVKVSLRFLVGVVSTFLLGLGVFWKLISKNQFNSQLIGAFPFFTRYSFVSLKC